MPERILIVVATEAEADALKKTPGLIFSANQTGAAGNNLSILVTGVGGVSTAWEMTKWMTSNLKPDLAVNAGIAGSFREDIRIGDVVMPVSDCFADAGIEEEGGFLTLPEAGLADPDQFPFSGGRLVAENQYVTMAGSVLKPVNAITVNTVTGSADTIKKLTDKYNPDIETMEGATFFYICMREKIPFIALRSISNRVEPRNRSNWNITLALENLSEKMKEIIKLLY